MTTGETITLTRWTFVSKVMSQLFNMLSRLVITFLPRGKHCLILWLQSSSAVILEQPPNQKKSLTLISSSNWQEELGLEIETDFIFLGSKITADGDCSHEIKRCLLLGRQALTNLDSILKSRDITLSTKVRLVKAMVFPVVMYGWMWELDYKESWELKNWCFWTAVLEKTLESPLDCKEIQPVHPKGNQSWIFIRRTDVEAETLILWPPDLKSWLIWKDPDAEKDWRREEKGTTEDEMAGWHHRLNGHEFE